MAPSMTMVAPLAMTFSDMNLSLVVRVSTSFFFFLGLRMWG